MQTPETRKLLTKKEKKRQEIALHNADYELAKFNERVAERKTVGALLDEVQHAGNVGKSKPTRVLLQSTGK